jgi:hypothetical protein
MLYADVLRTLPAGAKEARNLLKTADVLYNELLNWDTSSTQEFQQLMAATPAIIRLREAGKRLRAVNTPAPLKP